MRGRSGRKVIRAGMGSVVVGDSGEREQNLPHVGGFFPGVAQRVLPLLLSLFFFAHVVVIVLVAPTDCECSTLPQTIIDF